MTHFEVTQTTRDDISPLTQCINESMTIQVNKGEILFWPEDEANSAYYVNSGVIKICRYTEDGQEVIVDLVRAGPVCVTNTTGSAPKQLAPTYRLVSSKFRILRT